MPEALSERVKNNISDVLTPEVLNSSLDSPLAVAPVD
jgi:hypothetical protein